MNTLNREREGGLEDTLDIGGRLRHLREAAGLSQRMLAKRAGITNSTISLVESGRSNPSVGQLKRILDAIPIGLAEFFAMEWVRDESPFHAAADLIEIGRGPISYRQVGRTMIGRQLQILSECYQPGADTGRIPLRHDGEEGGVVISGHLEVTVDGQKRVLGPGDAYSFGSNRPHRFRCIGDEPARVVSACTPPTF
ncbi:cupin domain-containing protein [Niveispirillum sp.]|uniref:cupin domain-containing protein n=1 Tax=Niveispirillum sp. TaxID=1917217 RepID=UPI001B571AA6|nr:cupin domain-containing protein [Niveispirillum sp.]MBP7339187.1 cupin domain-containing protein [Niveispirillum sp.]